MKNGKIMIKGMVMDTDMINTNLFIGYNFYRNVLVFARTF